MPKLVLQFDERDLNEYPLANELTIGRLPDNTVVIDNPAVSGHHARVFLEGSEYVIEDLESKNGTYVNEKHVLRATLRNRDVLLIGKHKLLFDQSGSARPVSSDRRLPTLGKTAYLNTKKHRDLLAKLRAERARAHAQAAPSVVSGGKASLRILDGQTPQREYALESRISFIGKSEDALIRLHGWLKPKTAAAIVVDAAGYTVTDFDGRTLVNSQPLQDGSQQLKDGDIVEAGGLVIQFNTGSPLSAVAEARPTGQSIETPA